MSIVSLSDGSSSSFTAEDLKDLAAQINAELTDSEDTDNYLRLLWSFEAVMKQIGEGPDYIHPALQPQALSTGRHYWKPSPEDNPFNAWSHRCDLRAANPTSDLLKGRTVAIKDNISVAGLPTTLGAPASLVSEDGVYPISPIDATVVSRLLAAGAVIKGTSTCECFCASPLSFTSATGPVHNPRLHGYTAGGSSSGSCALVAAHSLASEQNDGRYGPFGETVELAIGSDQAGSVRIPASYNGIYGLKPTFGLVPYTGAASMSPMIDHLGPIASRLEDVAALLEVMAGYDGLDPRMTPESPLVGQVKPYSQLLSDFRQQILAEPSEVGQGWRIGLLSESFLVPGVAPEVRDTVRDAARRFFEAVGATVAEISVPIHREGPVIWTAATRPSMSSWLCQRRPSGHLSYLPPHLQSRWPLSQETYEVLNSTNPALVNIILSERFAQRFLPAGIEAKAHRKVFELREAYDKALEEVDVLVTPCAPTVAMPHPRALDEEGWVPSIMERLAPAIGLTSNTCPFNVTGHPALNVPCGVSSPPERPDVRLPIGMQIIGKRWKDEQVLEAAALFERGRELAST
ncbi:amidase signature enzyme [Coniochaeta ligniaria NRRL 30616]|uniref:Amidase signature enzyme n=1 Tax=Coniochaeta ligniaria NRRL 30616 TaxID=1408157 RepID=A0A1J7J3X8_9PEZI|nr:amidase signature enzyme [Coniochaeta ligniaria NRRL 30616]